MNIRVLSPDLIAKGIIDNYESLIWNECYSDYGDFEIYSTVNENLLSLCQINNYLMRSDSDRVMIIDRINIKTDTEEGNHITITGRTVESILTRRIIWNQTTISGSVQNGIKTLINDAIINPSDSDRKIENFIFEESDDPAVTSLEMNECQYDGENLYDVIREICCVFKIGFKITLVNNQWVFKLYAGKDRSYNQDKLPYIVFSHNFGNLIDSDFTVDLTNFKNTSLVAGEGEGTDRKRISVSDGSTGINRRELYYESSVSSTSYEQHVTEQEYLALLQQDGIQNLVDYGVDNKFEGSADISELFVYGRDFFMGDVLQVIDEFGNGARSRVDKLVTTHDNDGLKTYPSFVIEEEDAEEDTEEDNNAN